MDLKEIITNPWVGFIGTVVGFLSVLISVVFYFRSRKVQIPAYFKNSLNWYDNKSVPHDEIKLTFRGKEIPRFTITHLAFWNAGNQPIKKSDFVPASPLRLAIPPNTEVFNIKVTACTASEINVLIESTDSFVAGAFEEVKINFDYLDAHDGFAIQIIHDSPSDDGFQFIGKIPGVTKFRLGGVVTPELISPLKNYLIFGSAFFCLGGVGIWSIYSAFYSEFHWYHIFGGLLVIYLFWPLIPMFEISTPKALYKALSTNFKSSNQNTN